MEHQQTKKGKNLFSFFKSRDNSPSSSNVDTPVPNDNLLLNVKELKLIVLLFSRTQRYVVLYGSIPLINEIHLDERILRRGQLNLNLKSIHDPNVENKTVDFNTLGLNNFPG